MGTLKWIRANRKSTRWWESLVYRPWQCADRTLPHIVNADAKVVDEKKQTNIDRNRQWKEQNRRKKRKVKETAKENKGEKALADWPAFFFGGLQVARFFIFLNFIFYFFFALFFFKTSRSVINTSPFLSDSPSEWHLNDFFFETSPFSSSFLFVIENQSVTGFYLVLFYLSFQ